MTNKNQNFLDLIGSLSEPYNKAMSELKQVSEQKWQALSTEDQLDYFCAVVRRIYQAELLEQRSYRGVLYETFGFDFDSYTLALEAGYLELHNSIYTHDSKKDLLAMFARTINPQLSKEQAQELAAKFLIGDVLA